MQTFYDGVTQPIWSTINAAVASTLMNKTKDKTYNLIEDMTLNNYQWLNERGQPRRVRGKLEVDFFAKDTMTPRLDRLNVNALSSSVSPPLCEICSSVDNLIINCKVESLFA